MVRSDFVFSDGSFVYIPKGVRCPMELSSYFRINARNYSSCDSLLLGSDCGAYTFPYMDVHNRDKGQVPGISAPSGYTLRYDLKIARRRKETLA